MPAPLRLLYLPLLLLAACSAGTLGDPGKPPSGDTAGAANNDTDTDADTDTDTDTDSDTDTDADSDTDTDADADSDTGTSTNDADGDGFSAPDDCDDQDASLYPGAPALCTNRTCGWDFCGGLCGGTACASGTTSNTVLQIVANWEITATSDAMLSADPNESPSGGSFEGQIFYAAADAADGDVPLYRLHHSAPQTDADDHMISTDPTEGSPDFVLEGSLAHGWSAAADGMEALYRYYSANPYDHDAAFLSSPPAGYAAEGALAHVYPRYGLDDEQLTSVSGTEVDLAVNEVAGGALWSLQWGGVEFLSAYDFGRQLQIAFQANGAGEADNPTEAGDAYASPSDPQGWRHGSPLLELSTAAGWLSTRTRPLQWLPGGFHSGAQTVTANPVAWNGNFEKEITLDYAGNPHILAWTTRIVLPEAQGSLNIELATAYLTGQFDSFYTYNAASGSMVDKTAGIPSMGCVDPSLDSDQQPTAGGVIISTASGSHALGVYRNRSLNSVEGYGLCSFLDGTTGAYDFGTSKWNLLERPTGGLDAGTYAWDFFIVVGSLADCTAAMDELYARGD